MKKGFARYLPIWLIMFAATLIIFNIIQTELNISLKPIYYPVIIVFALELIIASYVLNYKTKDISQPLFIYSLIGLAIVFIINNLLIFLGVYESWIYTIANVITLSLHYIFLLTMNASLSANKERDENIKNKTDFMLNTTNKVKSLYDITKNEDIYRLYESLKYSNKDIKNNVEYQKQLENYIDSLRNIKDGKTIKNKVDEIIDLIKNNNYK